MTTQPDPHDVESLFLCATNEGDLYHHLCTMGAAGVNCPDSNWASLARGYVQRLMRERRYAGRYGAATVNALAFRLRDHYIAHAAELARSGVQPDPTVARLCEEVAVILDETDSATLDAWERAQTRAAVPAHPDATKPIRELACTCCGGTTRGRQWWNRDKGYGLCLRCIAFVAKGETPESMRESYGVRGVHYACG